MHSTARHFCESKQRAAIPPLDLLLPAACDTGALLAPLLLREGAAIISTAATQSSASARPSRRAQYLFKAISCVGRRGPDRALLELRVARMRE